jgi:ATP-binding cassette, subfamily B, bacterial
VSGRTERLRLIGRVIFADRRRAVAVMAVSVATGVTGSLVALLMKVLVDGASAGDGAAVVVVAMALAVCWTASGGAASWASNLLSDLHESSGRALTEDLMALMASAPGIEHHERPDYLDRVALLRRNARLLSGMLRTLSDLVNLVLRVGGTALLLATVDWRLSLVALFALPSVAAGSRARRITEAADEAVAARGRLADSLLALSWTGNAAGEVRVCGLGEELARRVGRLWDETHAETERAQAKASLVRLGGWLVFAAGYVGAVAVAVGRALDGQASVGDVAMVVALVSQVNGQVGQTVAVLTQSLDANRAAHRLQWLHRYAAATVGGTAPAAPAAVPDRIERGIRLDGVTFRYPGTERDALDGVTLDLPAGSTVALVGENGAGKTTLVKLLCRFYEPTAGRLTVDGVDLPAIPAAEWRRHLTAAFQDFARVEFLLRESVGIGDLAGIDDEARVGDALAGVGAADLGPLGTQLGVQRGGSDLSTGQWQKVAVARASMRTGPLLLVLDEPTSGLDAHAEHVLFERYAAAARDAGAERGAVTVLVSHRFSTVRMADLIVVLAGGRVVEQGSHADLCRAGGLYAELYGIGARAFEDDAQAPSVSSATHWPGGQAGPAAPAVDGLR